MRNCNNEFILKFMLCEKRCLISNANNLKSGWNSCTGALLNVITSAKVLLNLRKMPKLFKCREQQPHGFFHFRYVTPVRYIYIIYNMRSYVSIITLNYNIIYIAWKTSNSS